MLSVLYTTSAFLAFSVISGSRAFAIDIPALSTRKTPQHDFQAICYKITPAISNVSRVFFPPATEYASDNEHAFVSSSEVSACSVEPGSTQDLSLIVRRCNTTIDGRP
ncbi:hypothetical protein H4582DRAFT_1951670 [Lactarius indigo]|nr:hypothetical protein H4582DRAFT_1951670 [Lactarius indigo]